MSAESINGAAAGTARGHISADSHVIEPDDCYFKRIDPKFRDRAPRVTRHPSMGDVMSVDQGWAAVPLGLIAAAGRKPEELVLHGGLSLDDMHPGGWNPRARLEAQVADGVSAEVLYPSVGMLICNHPDYDYKHACFDAYNLWLAEYCATAPKRLIGIGQTAMRTIEEGIADLERIKKLGLKGAMLPGIPAVDDYWQESYDPVWEAAAALELPLSFHILTGGKGAHGRSEFRGPKINSFLTVIHANQDIIGAMIYGGVFERHPQLQVVCVEADAGWVPHYMYRMDHAFERHRNWMEVSKLSMRPSEYLRRNVYMTFQDDWVAFKVCGLMNVDRLMWANDFPHSDSTWPHSQGIIAKHTEELAEHQRRRILGDNCVSLYGLDLEDVR
jgi:predicted TIM-barrel fold metal-dependent hydrolase